MSASSIARNDRLESGTRRDPLLHRLRAHLHRHLVYPGVVLLRGERDVFAVQRELAALEYESAERLRTHQHAKLWSALRYAYAHSPYYRAHWPAPPAATDEADAFAYLRSLPFVEKSTLQLHHADLAASPGPRRVTRKTTGGSTGQAVTLLKDRDALAREMAASWLAYGWYGVERGDRAVRFWGDPSSLKRKLRFMAADFAMNRVRFSAFAFSDGDMESYWRRCVSTRPDYFYGYVSMLVAFAQYLRRAGHDGQSLGLKAVITTSEVLERPHQELLAETFGCPVQNEYGCGEVGPVAYSCPEGSLHLMADNLVVEVLTASGQPAQPGESGELVLTDLNNRAMPLVRYRVGDLAVAGGACACGRSFPTLQRVWGRAYDVLVAPDGRRYHGEYFMYLFEDLRQQGLGVDQFQVVQTSIDTLQVYVVTPGPLRQETTDFIVSRIGERMTGMTITVERVPELRRAASGKMRVIVNAMTQAATTTA